MNPDPVVQSLCRLWALRHAAEADHCGAALALLRRLAAEHHPYTGARSMAWQLVVDVHAACGATIPDEPGLATCRSAAASTSHSAQLLAESIDEALADYDDNGRVLVLGDLAFGWSLFGRWDLLPARGVLLVDLDEALDRPPCTTVRADDGVRWGAPGPLRELLAGRTAEGWLNGRALLLPPVELILARTAPAAGRGEPAGVFLFTAAAQHCLSHRGWSAAQDVARALGLGDELRQAVVACRLHHDLHLRLSPLERARAWFTTMSRRAALS